MTAFKRALATPHHRWVRDCNKMRHETRHTMLPMSIRNCVAGFGHHNVSSLPESTHSDAPKRRREHSSPTHWESPPDIEGANDAPRAGIRGRALHYGRRCPLRANRLAPGHLPRHCADKVLPTTLRAYLAIGLSESCWWLLACIPLASHQHTSGLRQERRTLAAQDQTTTRAGGCEGRRLLPIFRAMEVGGGACIIELDRLSVAGAATRPASAPMRPKCIRTEHNQSVQMEDPTPGWM